MFYFYYNMDVANFYVADLKELKLQYCQQLISLKYSKALHCMSMSKALVLRLAAETLPVSTHKLPSNTIIGDQLK